MTAIPTPAPPSQVVAIDGGAGSVGGDTAGSFGKLVLNADGSFTYAVDQGQRHGRQPAARRLADRNLQLHHHRRRRRDEHRHDHLHHPRHQ
jgi:hypothetical protein